MEVGNSSNSNSNHQMKRREVVAGEAKEDRISRLPDSILHRILSSNSITMKDAVQTCVLSKRWRHVWTTLPTLVFDYGQFRCSAAAADGKSDRLRVFTHFVNRVLSLRDHTSSNVFNFSLLCPFLENVYRILVNKCICYAVCHNAQQLHIDVGTLRGLSRTASPFVFPHCLINCDPLKVLKMVYFEGMPMDKSLRLPGLKTLQLNRFSDGSANFITETVGNCPNLEDLRLGDFRSNHFDITAPQLRNLELCFQGELFWISSESEIVVSTPKLTSFKLEGNVSPVFSDTASLPSLDNVQVDICTWIMGNPKLRRRMPLNVIKMFGKLGQAKTVTLSWNTLQILGKNPATFKTLASPFHNLEHLNLIAPREGRCSSLTFPLKVISYLIQGSSCGDTLVVNFPKV